MCVCVCVENLVLALKLSAGSCSSMPLADTLSSLPVCWEADSHTHKHTHADTYSHSDGAGQSARLESSNEMRERGRREGRRVGGGSSAESSTFPQPGDLTHGSHTFLSPAAGRAQALREAGRGRNRPHAFGGEGACSDVFHICVSLTCASRCLTLSF